MNNFVFLFDADKEVNKLIFIKREYNIEKESRRSIDQSEVKKVEEGNPTSGRREERIKISNEFTSKLINHFFSLSFSPSPSRPLCGSAGVFGVHTEREILPCRLLFNRRHCFSYFG